MRRHRKRQADIHAGRIAFDGRVEKILNFREIDNLVEFSGNFSVRHAQNGAVEKNVLAPCELLMKSRAHFQQARGPAIDPEATFCWNRNATQKLEKRTLAGSVAADDSDYF